MTKSKMANRYSPGRVGKILGNEAAGNEVGRAVFGGIQMRTETRKKDRENVQKFFEKRKGE